MRVRQAPSIDVAIHELDHDWAVITEGRMRSDVVHFLLWVTADVGAITTHETETIARQLSQLLGYYEVVESVRRATMILRAGEVRGNQPEQRPQRLRQPSHLPA